MGRRSRPALLLAAALLVLLLPAAGGVAAQQAVGPGQPTALAERLGREPRALDVGPNGVLRGVFGVPLAEAGAVFYPVSRLRGLPDSYQPPDLVDDLGHPLRALVVGEFTAMFAAASRDGADPEVVSGYRSAEYQAALFERAVQLQLARDGSIDRPEAERRAARFVAPPGRSQHQLGTTADLSSWEIGYGLREGFGETTAGRWLAAHAWEYGFVIPYTPAAEPRTGYVSEPWHLRWVGKPLAAFLWEQGYLVSANPAADDWLLGLEEVVRAALAPPPTPTATATPTAAPPTPTPGPSPTPTPLPTMGEVAARRPPGLLRRQPQGVALIVSEGRASSLSLDPARASTSAILAGAGQLNGILLELDLAAGALEVVAGRDLASGRSIALTSSWRSSCETTSKLLSAAT